MRDAIDKQTNDFDLLSPLVDRLKQLKDILAQNSYVSDATRRLDRIIDDAQNPPTILFLGKERVGKTTLINALLGRDVLSLTDKNPTAVNMFIRYGKQEEIKAYFLDGVVATFDIETLEMLSTSTQFSSQILREHMDYLELYLNHELLKEVTLIDTTALELGGGNAAYFSEALIHRVDELFWVLRCGSIAADAEIHLLEKLNAIGKQPLCLINGIDYLRSSVDDFVASETARIGHLTRGFISVSAIDAIDANRYNDSVKWHNSHFELLEKELNKIAGNKDKKTRQMLERFMNWLTYLQLDIANIPQREPYSTALKSVERYTEVEMNTFTRRQRDLAIATEYEEEYKQVSKVFNDVETLYQLLQNIEQHPYLQDEQVAIFVEHAVNYQQVVREYRKLNTNYLHEHERLDAQHKKIYGKSLMKSIFRKQNQSKQDEYFIERVHKLNEQQAECATVYANIQVLESHVLNELYMVQNHLMELVKIRLENVKHKMLELNAQRKKEHQSLKFNVAKLNEFTCLVEAQGFIRDAIGPYMKNAELPLSHDEVIEVEKTITAICNVNLTNSGVLARKNLDTQQEDTFIVSDFSIKYPLQALKLTEADIRSEVPAIPELMQISQ